MLVIVLNVVVPITNSFPLAPIRFSEIELPSISVPFIVNVVVLWSPPTAVNNLTFPPYPIWLLTVPSDVFAETGAEDIKFISLELL